VKRLTRQLSAKPRIEGNLVPGRKCRSSIWRLMPATI
jgi:hypothetical protein